MPTVTLSIHSNVKLFIMELQPQGEAVGSAQAQRVGREPWSGALCGDSSVVLCHKHVEI